MKRLTKKQLEILQEIANKIDTEKYYHYDVVQFYDGVPISPNDDYDEYYYMLGDEREDGIYLIPEEGRYIGDTGEFMGFTFEQAKVAIDDFVSLIKI